MTPDITIVLVLGPIAYVIICTSLILFSVASSQNGPTIRQYSICDSANTWYRIQSILF